jgi:cob(I)alamin adenosyltransferase
MKIYTKTGDGGATRLVDGRECSKADPRVEAYGTVDELNSCLGVVLSQLPILPNSGNLLTEIVKIQNELFNIGSHLACQDSTARERLPEFSEAWILRLESSIDKMTAELPPLTQFILPGGSTMSAFFHLSRTVCRRSERLVAKLLDESGSGGVGSADGARGGDSGGGSALATDRRALIYLNRLSDYLFTAARYVNLKAGVADLTWKKE